MLRVKKKPDQNLYFHSSDLATYFLRLKGFICRTIKTEGCRAPKENSKHMAKKSKQMANIFSKNTPPSGLANG